MGYVLLTAAVTPDPRYGSAISDAGVRLAQYQHALSNWASVAAAKDWSIVLVETTGCSGDEMLGVLGCELRKSVEFLNFSPAAALSERGKGAVEASAIDHALLSLRLPDNATFYKATGRLTLQNAGKLLTKVEASTATVRRTLDGTYCDTRFFATTVGFWRERLSGMEKDVDDESGRYLEHVMANRLRHAEYFQAVDVRRFQERPLLVGVSGTNGVTYGRIGATVREKLLGSIERNLLSKLMKKQL